MTAVSPLSKSHADRVASVGSVKGLEALLYSRATAATLPGILQPPNVPRVLNWFQPKLDAARMKLQDRFLMLKRYQQAVAARSRIHKASFRFAGIPAIGGPMI